MVPCPACSRPNAPHRPTCLYCGAAMPNPSAPPPEPARRELPENLDELIAEAMRRGSTAKLAAALRAGGGAPASGGNFGGGKTAGVGARIGGGEATEGARGGTSALEGGRGAAREDEDGRENDHEDDHDAEDEGAPTVGATPDAGLAALAQTLAEAQAAWAAQDLAGARDALERLAPLASATLATLPLSPAAEAAPSDDDATPERPSFRVRAALVVDGPGDPELAGALSEALDVDFATARLIAISQPMKIAARAETPEPLMAKAERVRALTALRASVLTREDLEATPLPEVLLALDGETWRVTAAPAWRLEPDQVRALESAPRAPSPVSLAVQGEIVLRRYRQTSGSSRYGRKRDAKLEKASERRVGVVDLHAPGLFLRVVEGVSEVGDPEQRSSRLRFQSFCDALEAAIPGLRLEPRRICRAPELLSVPDGHDPAAPLETSGWSDFEEHTRLARLHVLGAGA